MSKMFSGLGLMKSANFEATGVLDALPTAVMTCDIKDFRIDYANRASIELLRTIEHLLSVSADTIVGTSIDVFHKHPTHQRRLLADAKNLPHEAKINLGEEVLELNISPLFDSKGTYHKAVLVWNVITEKVKADREAKRLLQMIDKMPINVMTCDPDTFKINYVNETSIKTLQPLEEHLPIRASELRGQSIDIFHKNPGHQQRILKDPSKLPWRANIKLGPEYLRLDISAIMDDSGGYLGPMLTWSVISDQVQVAEQVTGVVEAMNGIADGLTHTAGEMITIADSAKSQATSVTSAAEEMTASISEISNRMDEAAKISRDALNRAQSAAGQISTLKAASEQIGSVMATIQAIADQTKLLALNATIEAARAGDAGRGFAVVAAEVKELSEQTTRETDQIGAQIEAMQKETTEALTAIQSIMGVIANMDEHSAAVAASMTQQHAAAQEVARAISGVTHASETTTVHARGVREIVAQVDGIKQSNSQIEAFLRSR
ncbi:chemotaxis protein [Roseibium aquae]|uniref:Chemotaxis protein n=1 Tax=Roseibium aquae TaxID=1323746 RepID=A0A916T845_9HYPH|nr:methyl-accepting chemotaxis protein [Roseibium aquae]GGB35443.1 chemotaxis protein [Roseibium aquae]